MEQDSIQSDNTAADSQPSGGYQDKILKCKDCGQEFIWTAGEQEFFFSRGFKNKPARCKDCRKKNRQKVEAEYFRVTCSRCQQVGDVLFQPASPEAQIYCKNCFDEVFLKSAEGATTS